MTRAFGLLVLEDLYLMDGKSEPVFRRVSTLTDKEVARAAGRVHRRVSRLLELLWPRPWRALNWRPAPLAKFFMAGSGTRLQAHNAH